MRDRIIDFRRVPASMLKPNPKNWRTHPANQREYLTGVLKEIGIADAAIARQLPDGSLELIDGHLRTDILHNQDVPVLVLDVSQDEADTILATLDPLTELAGRDSSKLDALIGSIKTESKSIEDLLASIKGSGQKAEESLASEKRSHKSTSTESYADPETEFRETGTVSTYTIAFDSKDQLEEWYQFLKWLNKNVEGQTIGQRLTAFAKESQE